MKGQLTNYKQGKLNPERTDIISPTETRAWQCDPMGNWKNITINGEAQTRSHNSSNQTTFIEGQQLTYDSNGNLTQDTFNQRKYVYDLYNRLIEVRDLNNNLIDSYTYDALGHRVMKNNTEFVYDGWNIVEEITGGSTKEFIWGKDLSGSMQGAGGVGGLLSMRSGGFDYYYQYDANGNVRELTDAVGTIVFRYEYTPLGKLVSDGGDTGVVNPFRFSTKYYDGSTGLSYYGYRFYDSELGRWLNRDPIEEDGGYNLYGMVGNRVVNEFDLFGLTPGEPLKKIKIFNCPFKKCKDDKKRELDDFGKECCPEKMGEIILRVRRPKTPYIKQINITDSGHVYISSRGPNAASVSFGFYPQEGEFMSRKIGVIINDLGYKYNDKLEYKACDSTRNLMHTFINSMIESKKVPYYHLWGSEGSYQCASFACKLIKTLGGKEPGSLDGSKGKNINPENIDTSN